MKGENDLLFVYTASQLQEALTPSILPFMNGSNIIILMKGEALSFFST
jgi:hypothetical protein